MANPMITKVTKISIISNEDSSKKVIYLDLRNVFNDHRQRVMVSVDDTMINSISDLQNRIKRIFKIKKPFYLMNDECYYLHPHESVNILRDREHICLHLKCAENEVNGTGENVVPIVVDSRPENISDNEENLNEITIFGSNDNVIDPMVVDSKTANWYDNKEKYVNNITTGQTLTNKVDVIGPQNQTISNDNLVTTRVLGLNDIIDFSECKAKRKRTLEAKDDKNRKTNRVFQHKINTADQLPDDVIDTASKTLFTTWSETNTETCIETTNNLEESGTLLADQSEINSINSMDTSRIEKRKREETNLTMVNRHHISNTNLNASLTHKPNRKRFSGVGAIIKLIQDQNGNDENKSVKDTSKNKNTNSFIDIEIENESYVVSPESLETDFVTKRKRHRIRRRKSKQPTDDIIESPKNSVTFHPPKTKAAPKIHKRFSEEDVSITSDDEGSFNASDPANFMHSTPCSMSSKMSVIPEESVSELMESKPKVEDRILFKILRLDEKYSPIISNYIYGQVIKWTDDRGIRIKIIKGHSELKDPEGKFSIEENENFEKSILDIDWKQLLDVRLVNNKC